MEKFKLNNGVTVVIANRVSEVLSVSVTVNVGHVNEPKLRNRRPVRKTS